jgi:hypothetical protein
MGEQREIQMGLIKLRSGERFLRLTDERSGLSLEKKLDPKRPIFEQKQELLGVFDAALARAASLAA